MMKWPTIDACVRSLGAAGGSLCAVLLMVTYCAVCAWLTVPAFAAETEAPRIESVSWGVGGQITLGAKINPEGLETTYEITAECISGGDSSCEVPNPQKGAGHLAASLETQKVELVLVRPPSGDSYWFSVRATNSVGSAYWRTVITVPAEPPGACPNGCPTDELEKTEIPSWITAVNEAESAKVLKEWEAIEAAEAAKKHEEQQAREKKLLNEEEELKRREVHAPTCVVPSLKGYTVSIARRALKRAHCRLGKIIRPSRRHGTLRVISQSPVPGVKLAAGALITCRLGPRVTRRR